MNFLNSKLLPGLIPLVALPLVIHFLNRVLPRLFAFSPLTYIRESVSRHSWFFRRRHLIMALVRTGFLFLLMLAFLKPVINRLGPSVGDMARIVAGQSEHVDAVPGQPMFHYFILAALILLMLENGFQLLLKKLVTP